MQREEGLSEKALERRSGRGGERQRAGGREGEMERAHWED